MSADQSHVMAGLPGIGGVADSVKTATNKLLIPGIIGGLGTAFLGPAGPILGTLAGAGINFALNRIENGIQNRYNAPKQVMHRLAQANLPGAAILQGVGNKSASSSQNYTQSDIGTSEAISKEQVNRYQKQQFALMQRDMQLKEAAARKANAGAYLDEVYGDYYGRTADAPQSYSNFGQMIQAGQRLKESQTFLTQNKGLFQGMQNDVYQALKKEGVQVDMAKGQLKIIQGKVPLQKAQKALMDQQVQESISRINKNIVMMEAAKTQMSVAQQTIRLRQLDDYVNNLMLEDMTKQHMGAFETAANRKIFNTGFKPY